MIQGVTAYYWTERQIPSLTLQFFAQSTYLTHICFDILICVVVIKMRTLKWKGEHTKAKKEVMRWDVVSGSVSNPDSNAHDCKSSRGRDDLSWRRFLRSCSFLDIANQCCAQFPGAVLHAWQLKQLSREGTSTLVSVTWCIATLYLYVSAGQKHMAFEFTLCGPHFVTHLPIITCTFNTLKVILLVWHCDDRGQLTFYITWQ